MNECPLQGSRRDLRPARPFGMDGLDAVAAALSHPDSLAAVVNPTDCDAPMPSQEKLVEILDRIKEVIFPGYFGPSRVHTESLRYHMAANLDSIYRCWPSKSAGAAVSPARTMPETVGIARKSRRTWPCAS